MCVMNTEKRVDFNEEIYIKQKMGPRKNEKDDNYECKHTPEQRSFIGTYTHMELKIALEAGFKIKQILWVWNWKEWDNNLFKPFIAEYYKMKEESSWDETRPIEEKLKKMRDFLLKYGVNMEPDKMEKNPGRRCMSKENLNSVIFFFAIIQLFLDVG